MKKTINSNDIIFIGGVLWLVIQDILYLNKSVSSLLGAYFVITLMIFMEGLVLFAFTIFWLKYSYNDRKIFKNNFTAFCGALSLVISILIYFNPNTYTPIVPLVTVLLSSFILSEFVTSVKSY